MAVHKMLFSQFKVSIRGTKLTAIISGEPVDIPRHQPAVEVKGATFSELKVYQSDGIWVAQCVVDV
ncbi:Archease [Legionella wadsworthii]|uniref:Archease n=1 Tax=Legionella wadsworthii TaxID=28088 RepID=A0A378LP64_9GAMM|nr:Archease [Legionella wadsworthii]